MKVLITGGAGFIGTNLSNRLTSLGHSVIILDDLSTGLKSNIRDLDTFCQGSILDRTLVHSLVKNVDSIVHLAALGSVPRSIKNPQSTFDVNVVGTQTILECAREYKRPIIFSSSSSVYGLNKALPKTEDMVLKPNTPYAASKMAAEGLVFAYSKSYEFPATIFRFFNVFGPYQRADHQYAAVIPKWIDCGLKNRPIELFGDGSQTRDFTYIDTVIDVLVKSIELPTSNSEPINLALGNQISLNTLISYLKKSFPNLKVNVLEPRLGDLMHGQNNPNNLKKFFPEISAISFIESIDRTIYWMKNK